MKRMALDVASLLILVVGFAGQPMARGVESLPPITALVVTPNGTEVVAGSQAGLELRRIPHVGPAVLSRTTPHFDLIRKLPTELEHIHDLKFSPDGNLLCVVGGSPSQHGSVELYRWPDATLHSRRELHEDINYSVAWRADSKSFAVASSDTRVSICDINQEAPLRVIEGHSRSVLAVAFLPGEYGLASGGVDESIRLWEPTTGKLLRSLSNHTKSVTSLAVRPGDWPGPPTLASIGLDHTVRLWQPTIGRLMRFARLPSPPLDVGWLNDGNSIVVACKDGKLRVIDPDSMEVLEEIPAIDGIAYCLAVLPNGTVVVGGQSGQLTLQTPRSGRGGKLTDPNLGKVELIRDSWGVPHVFADTDGGAFFGLGFASAEDRGFQMHYNLRTIQGRMSEIFGQGEKNRYLTHDRKMRALGFYRTAREVSGKLDAQSLEFLQCYCDGVNEWFAKHPDQHHPLFKKLEITPEPWTVADCIASWWYLGQFFSGDGLHKLENYRNMMKPGATARPSNIVVDDTAAVVGLEDVSPTWVEQINQYQRKHGYVGAGPGAITDSPSFSHAWVVGGKRSTTGSAVLVSDPQVPVCNPSVFYEFHVCGSSINARGAGVPGSPGLLIGFNQSVAWGITALGADQADLFRLKTDKAYPNQYQLDGEWLDMQSVRESIRVKGGSPVEMTVRLTRFGPVVSEFAQAKDGDPEVALKRVPLCDTDRETIQGVFQMMLSTDMASFVKGLAQWRIPSVNVVFGDQQGNVGYWMQAAIPARSRHDPHRGEVAQDGSQSQNDWQGFVPHDLLPHVINPKRGWIASGNHRPIGSFYPIPFGIGKGSTGHSLRSWRLYERLAEKELFQPSDVLAIHFDDTCPMRRDVLRIGRHLDRNAGNELSAPAKSTLTNLDFWYQSGSHSDMNLTGSALSMELVTEFRAHATPLAKTYGGGAAGLKGLLVDVKARIDRNPQEELSADEIKFFEGVLASAWLSANKKYGSDAATWDEQARQRFQQQRRPYFDGMSGFGSIDPSGDLLSPALACTDPQTIKSQVGQGYTQYVPLGNVDAAQSILPPGQSERIDSRWRTSTWELWEQGALHPAPLSRNGVSAIAAQTSVLRN